MLRQPDWISRLAGAVFLILVGTGACPAQDEKPADNAAIRDAVRSLRGIHSEKLSEAEQERSNAAINKAWKLLRANKDKAIPALKKELDLLEKKEIRDDFFRLEAASLLYAMAELGEIAAIARAVEDVNPSVSIRLSFRLASQCARSQDPRVLPVMCLMLRTNKKSPEMFFPAHSLRVPWPMSLDFTWGPYGPGACGFLTKQLASRNKDVQLSALRLLTTYRHMPALRVCRKWAKGKDKDLRLAALRAIGTFAHPHDRDLLVTATRDKDPEIRFAAAYGLYEYGDPATAPALRALLGDPDPQVRMEAIVAVAHVIDFRGGIALASRLDVSKDGREKTTIQRMIDSLAKDAGADKKKLASSDVAEWKKATEAYWQKRDSYFDLREGDQKMTRKQFLEALAAWEKDHSITDREELEWIKRRHLLAVARPGDISRLLEVRASLLWRQSDEVLYEVRQLNRVIGVLHRRKVGARKPNE
ncbi:MAG: HEAT repeat domain-containing protein [Planctomycetota bacterium]|jgi:HEAT repeat protein